MFVLDKKASGIRESGHPAAVGQTRPARARTKPKQTPAGLPADLVAGDGESTKTAVIAFVCLAAAVGLLLGVEAIGIGKAMGGFAIIALVWWACAGGRDGQMAEGQMAEGKKKNSGFSRDFSGSIVGVTLLAIVVLGVFALSGCSAMQVRDTVDGLEAAVTQADDEIAHIEAQRMAAIAALQSLPEGEPGRDELLSIYQAAGEALEGWIAFRDQTQARLDQARADLDAIGDDDAAATLLGGAMALETLALAGVPFVGLGGVLLRTMAKLKASEQRRDQIATDTARSLAQARAASSEFDAAFNGPIGGVLRAGMPVEVQVKASGANKQAGVKAA